MDKKQKTETVKNLKKSFDSSEGVVVTHYIGLNTAEITELRNKVREVGARFCVAKNSLVKLALKDTQYTGLSDFFSGPTAIVFSEDPISGIKAVKNYSDKNEKLKFIKAALNEKVIDTDEFIALAKLPSLEEIRAKLAGYLVAPQQQLVQVLNAASTEVVGVLDNYSKK
ncbi:50S ribosomal protein L10 [Alphaproteobacteria bacterium]|nr:50S ribosomal protein L10 [Alphaproteobacteria bacterium]